jgi:hypothetical protein
MKRIILILCPFLSLLCSAQQRQGQEPLVTIDIRDQPLAQALAVIELRTGVRFAYPTELLHGQKNVTVTVTKMPLQEFLALFFRQTTLSYQLIGDQVVLQSPVSSPATTISGYVRDSQTGELLIGASVFLPASGTGVFSNNYGFYSLTVPGSDSIGLVVSYVGYRPQARRVPGRGDASLSISLEVDSGQAAMNKFTLFRDKREDFVRKTPLGMTEVSGEMVVAAPSASGSGDLISSVEMLPGVQAGIDGTPGFFVRGGNAGQNLILLDEATLYNPSHIFGLVSVFSPPTIKRASLIKGGFPAAYGDFVSSVLDVAMRDGSNQQTGGVVQAGSVFSGATLYGPIGHSSFLVSGRRSTTDVLLQPFLHKNYFSNYYFYDVNAKLNIPLSPRDRILLSFYTGRDNNTYSSDNTDSAGIGYSMHFGNTAFTARWTHQYSGKLFSSSSVEYNKYHQFLSATQEGYFAQLYSGIRDIDVKTRFSWYPGSGHTTNFGVDYLNQTLYPASLSGQQGPPDSIQSIVPSGIPPKVASRLAAYASDDLRFGRWQASVGVRFPYYFKSDAQYFSIEPRLSLLYLIDEQTSVKVSFASMHQYIHLVQSYNATFPAEIWIGSSNLVRPQSSREVSAGLFRNFAANTFQTSLEVYYKRLDNQLLFGGGSTPAIDNSIENQLIFGKGWDYGAEFFVRKNRGRWTGWLAYTLAYAYQQFDSLNEGVTFPFAYDRRQMLNISTAYALTDHWKIAANFLIASGRAFSLVPDSTFIPGGNPLYDNPGQGRAVGRGRGRGQGRGQGQGQGQTQTTSGSWNVIANNYRLSPYNRLDLSVHYGRTRATARGITESEWIFSVYNLYARANNSFVYRTIDPTTRKVVARELPLIPFIPSITYTYKF